MIAQFETTCGQCFERISEGVEILPSNHGYYRWRHRHCPEPAEPKQTEVCTVCFTAKSLTGACLCP